MGDKKEDAKEMGIILQPYIKGHKKWQKSSEFREWDEERCEKAARYQELLSKESISRMTEIEIHELISSLWAFGGWGNKDFLVDRLLKATSLNDLKQLLTDLIWHSDQLSKRYDHFNENVKYLGSAAITEILAFVHPKLCAIWNERARTALEKIGLLKDLVGKYWINGREYENICSEFRNIQDILNGEGIVAEDLLDVDLFLYGIAIAEELEEEKPKDYDFDHNEVKEKILEVGQYLGFEPEKEVQIAKGAKVDAIWTVHLGNLGVVKYVFEVQKSGSLDSLLLNLQRAKRNPEVQKEIIVSNTQGLQRAKEEAETLGEDFNRTLAYLEVTDVLKMAKSLKEAWLIINSLELVRVT